MHGVMIGVCSLCGVGEPANDIVCNKSLLRVPVCLTSIFYTVGVPNDGVPCDDRCT